MGLNFRNEGTCNPHFNVFEEPKMCHILMSNSIHYLIISGYIFLEEHYTMYITYYLIILE